MKTIYLALLILGLVSCSAKKQEGTLEEDDTAIELTDADDLLDDGGDDFGDDDLGDSADAGSLEGGDDAFAGESLDETPMEGADLGADTGAVVDDGAVMADNMNDGYSEVAATEVGSDVVIDSVGEVQNYTVEQGDTLMMISFKVYGDYGRWRDIAAMNQDKLINGQIPRVGSSLQYNAPAQPFSFNPEGNPYLIKDGDTLGIISNTTYGVPKYWRDIWDNNKPLIKDPNRIFAGFTIYTPNLDGRDVATE